MNEKVAVLDLSEPGTKIGEKLYALLNTEQKLGMTRYVLAQSQTVDFPSALVPAKLGLSVKTERKYDGLYFCLEDRLVTRATIIGSRKFAIPWMFPGQTVLLKAAITKQRL